MTNHKKLTKSFMVGVYEAQEVPQTEDRIDPALVAALDYLQEDLTGDNGIDDTGLWIGVERRNDRFSEIHYYP